MQPQSPPQSREHPPTSPCPGRELEGTWFLSCCAKPGDPGVLSASRPHLISPRGGAWGAVWCSLAGQRQWPRLVEPWALPVLRRPPWPLLCGFSPGSFGLGFISGASELVLLEPGFGQSLLPIKSAALDSLLNASSLPAPTTGFPARCRVSPCPHRWIPCSMPALSLPPPARHGRWHPSDA